MCMVRTREEQAREEQDEDAADTDEGMEEEAEALGGAGCRHIGGSADTKGKLSAPSTNSTEQRRR